MVNEDMNEDAADKFCSKRLCSIDKVLSTEYKALTSAENELVVYHP